MSNNLTSLRFLLAIFACVLSSGGVGRSACLSYDPSVVTLSGTLILHQGMRSWAGLKLDHAICTMADEQPDHRMAYTDVSELQIVPLNNEDLTPYFGQKTRISGKLFPKYTGHHMTDVLIIISSVSFAGPGTPPRSSGPLSKESVVNYKPSAFWASVTVLPKPIDRVVTQAWDKDPKTFFPNSDRYASHFFNGPMDVMWVNCLDGYSIGNVKSITGSGTFQMDSGNQSWGVAVTNASRTNITFQCTRASNTKD